MIRRKLYLLLLSLGCCVILNADASNIIIRKALLDDLPGLFELDKVVSYEYFLPMYSREYVHLPLGKNPEYYLDFELEHNKSWFPGCIEGKTSAQLWIAYDQTNGTVAGLIIAHQIDLSAMEIDLLLILKAYRRQGVGQRLIQHAIESYPNISVCVVYPLKYFNDETLAFYEAIGFVNQGIPTVERLNVYGIPYRDMYYHYVKKILDTLVPTE